MNKANKLLWYRGIVIALSSSAILLLITNGNLTNLQILGFRVSLFFTIIVFVLDCLALGLIIGINRTKSRIDIPLFWEKNSGLILGVSAVFILSIAQSFHLLFAWSIEGAQSVVSLWVWVLSLILFALDKQTDFPRLIVSIIPLTSAVCALAYVLSLFAGVQIYSGRGSAIVFVFGLSAAVVLPTRTKLAPLIPGVIYISILVSGSRTASLVALLLIGLIGLWYGRNTLRKILSTFLVYASATVIAILVYYKVPTAAERIESGDKAIQVNGATINTSGRLEAWKELIAQLKTSAEQWFGLGPGQASVYGKAHLKYFPQPHNEFIRQLVDNGLIGLLVFLAAAVLLIITLYLKWRKTKSPFTLVALLTTFSLLAISTTDNTLMAISVTLPSALLIGFGFSSKSALPSELH